MKYLKPTDRPQRKRYGKWATLKRMVGRWLGRPQNKVNYYYQF